MKRSVWLWITALCLLGVATGCNKPTPDTIRKGLNLAGEQGSYYGLVEWAKKNPAAAEETAQRLKASIDGTILPYLDGGDLPTSDLVQEFVDSTLLDGLPEEVKTAIIAASYALELYLPIPSATEKLSLDQVSYIKSFLSGLSEGCGKFLAKDAAPKAPKWLKKAEKELNKSEPTKWLTGKTKKKIK